MIAYDQTEFLSVYFHKAISYLNENTAKLDKAKQIKQLRDLLSQHKYPSDWSPIEDIGIDRMEIEKLEQIISQIKQYKLKLSDKAQALNKIVDAKKQFWALFLSNSEKAEFPANSCPLCGAQYDNLLLAITTAEKELLNSNEELQSIITDLQKDIDARIEQLITQLDIYIASSQDMLQMECLLGSVKSIDTSNLLYKLKRLNVYPFENKSELVSMENFSTAYIELMHKLDNMITAISHPISPDTMQVYKDIHLKYYKNNKPQHTAEMIQNKISYIAQQYAQKDRASLTKLKNEIQLLEKKRKYVEEEYQVKERTLAKLLDKYKAAQKKYHQSIQSAICMPLYIYSGKIIQNYPLGLGITAEIDNNKIIFKPENKDDDVYNVLSAGQLNGLAVSILMAVHDIYGASCGLNLIMIDDPLQTIDEISSISFADLLSEQLENGQVFISTHEEQKSMLLQYKFQQKGHFVDSINMQSRYLEEHIN